MRCALPLLLSACLGPGRRLVDAPIEFATELGDIEVAEGELTLGELRILDAEGQVVGSWAERADLPIDVPSLPGVLRTYEGPAVSASWNVVAFRWTGTDPDGATFDGTIVDTVRVEGVPVDWQLDADDAPSRFAWTLDLRGALEDDLAVFLAEPTHWTLGLGTSPGDR